ncbi:MAG: hypothetical protein AB7W16_08120 [Candidatus Obscuribacterales bacterium]
MSIPDSITILTPAEVEKRQLELLCKDIERAVAFCDSFIHIPDRYPQPVVDAVVEALQEKGWYTRRKQYSNYQRLEWSKTPFPLPDNKKSWWHRVSHN